MSFIKEIKWQQPKYILPLIILPFIFGFYYLIGRMQGVSEENEQKQVQREGYNRSIPLPASDQDIKSKFENLSEEFNSEKSNLRTHLEELGEEKIDDGIIVDLMTEQERMAKDSIDELKAYNKRMIKNQKDKIEGMIRENLLHKPVNHKADIKKIAEMKEEDILKEELTSITNNSSSKPKSELEDFKEHMRVLDSIQNPQKYIKKEVVVPEPEKVYPKLNNEKTSNPLFNTISRADKKTSIRALIDQGIIIYQGSRVRLRLMSDVFLDEYFLKKGTYLYGVVKNFKSQRVIINIPSILLDGEIVETNISLYDLDGLEGVFVPSSQFRAFVNDLGGGTAGQAGQGASSSNSSSTTTTGLGDKLLFDAATSAVQTSTKAIEKLIKKNKARFKYNSQVILKNN
ncbi:MAG: conjugative transposon protein TraM [Flavobacteriales bacterium]|jgi:conjugative transposon TraM protein